MKNLLLPLLLSLVFLLPTHSSWAQCNAATAEKINDAFQDLIDNPEIVIGTTRTYCVITTFELPGSDLAVSGDIILSTNTSPYPFSISIERVSNNQQQLLTEFNDVATVAGNTVYEVVITGIALGTAQVTFDPDFIGIGDQIATLTIIEDPAMPVTWSAPLTAQPADKTVALNWSVTDQIDVASYELQRSLGEHGNLWETVTEVPVRPLDGEIEYAVTDLRQLTETYYRIRQVDFDGSEDFSNVAYVAAATPSADLLVYPNPAGSEVFLRTEETVLDAKIYNRWGQLMKTVDLNAGTTRIRVDDLTPGLYIISIPGRKKGIHLHVTSK